MVYSVMRGSVKNPFERSHGGDEAGMDPELVHGVDLFVVHEQLRREEDGEWQVEEPA